MRLVVGWVASCTDLALDQIDDINLALETLLAGEEDQGDPLELRLSSEHGVVDVSLAGLRDDALRMNLEAGDSFSPSARWPLDVRLFLGALLDDYRVVTGGADSFGVLMQKRTC